MDGPADPRASVDSRGLRHVGAHVADTGFGEAFPGTGGEVLHFPLTTGESFIKQLKSLSHEELSRV